MQERNAANIYKARHVLLGLEDNPIEAEIPNTYIIQINSNNSNTVGSNGDADKLGESTKMNMLPYGILSK